MAITNLAGYTWTAGEDVILSTEDWQKNINFIDGSGTKHIYLKIAQRPMPYGDYLLSSSLEELHGTHQIYSKMGITAGYWYDPNCKQMTFIDGEAIADPVLIAWLEANGTLSKPVIKKIEIGGQEYQIQDERLDNAAYLSRTKDNLNNLTAVKVNDDNCVASGEYATAMGKGTTASGKRSCAEGYLTVASGFNSHAGGYNCTTTHNNGFVHGYKVRTSRDNQVVFGSNNIDNSDAVFIIGNGNDNVSSNLFQIFEDGSIKLNNTILTEAKLQELISLEVYDGEVE